MPRYCYDLQVTFYDLSSGEVDCRARYRGHAQSLDYSFRDLFYYRLRFLDYIRKQRPRRVAVRSAISRIRSLHLVVLKLSLNEVQGARQ